MKLGPLTAIAMTFMLGMIFFYAPIEKTQGMVQKIFYVHVSSALTMYLGYFIAFVMSIRYLIRKRVNDFYIAKSAIEVGYLFTCIVLLTGPVWAKPIWGTYWTWEPRLTTTFVLWLIYTAYLLFQSYAMQERKRVETLSSIIAIIAFLDVPLIHFSVKLWRGVHPSVIRNKDGLPPSMQATLIVSLCVMFLLFAYLFRHRLFLEKLTQELIQKGDQS